jgi:protein ImuB
MQFTPHVCCIRESLRERSWEAVLMETAASLRLWGGLPHLLALLRGQGKELGLARLATGSTGLVALARLCSQESGITVRQIDDLPLHTLAAAWPHLATLSQMGCTTWGQLAAMPRGGISRRFGVDLLNALDQAYGRKPETYSWLTVPEVFVVRHELHANVENASGLLFTASRQLKLLQAWLRARHQGIVACQFTWLLDIRRNAPPQGGFIVQTAQATQDIKHLERLLAEHLDRIELPAPAHTLELRSLRSEALPQQTQNLLLEEERSGEPLHYFIERVASKLGAGAIRRPLLQADHRPEAAQIWVSAAQAGSSAEVSQTHDASHSSQASNASNAFRPAWLMARPLRLLVRDDKPYYQGPLKLIQGPERLESSVLVQATPPYESESESASEAMPEPVARDYFIAWNAHAGLLWVFRERLAEQPGWYLHGLFA